MLLIKNYFETLPTALYESAKIDGAGEFHIFIKITLPLSLPTLATVALFYAVGFWNAYFNGILYISSPDKMPLQTYLQSLLNMSYIPAHELSPEVAESLSTESIRAATIFSATVPILILYPFLQKYFVKGLVMGSDR
jgi:putative aldouronate transport system permease protein